MKDDLDLVQAVLRAAEKQSFTNDAVRRWLQQLKAVAYNISDTLADGDDSSSCSCLERLKAANKINELKKKLTKVVERRTIFGFDLQTGLADEEAILKEVVEARQTMSSIDLKSTIVGRSKERKEIIGLLLKEEGTIILPIVGLGGMGKTTLAKLVYNDNKMEDFKGRKAWVYVSKKFDLIKIGKNVISELGGVSESCNDLQSVSKCLENILKDGKFFIVLDDLWEEDVEQLHKLKVMLQSGKSQLTMKIIVTTRAKAIAQEMCTHDTFDLKLLSDDNCWTVFKQAAFPSTAAFPCTAQKDAIGRDIAMKCNGLPLAAHTVGSMLRRKESVESWKAIRDSDTWNECDEKVLPSLRLSYDHMPYHLKQCFAYCAIFPKGFIINKNQLIQQWIALGFVQPFPRNLSHNAQAEQQVRDLLEISFLQNSISDSSSSLDIGNIAKAPLELSMHDLVHDLAAWVSGDETLTLDATKKNKGSNETRHVVVVNYDERRLSKSLPVNVRALHFRDCWGTQLPNNAFSSTRYVRVLDISDCAVGKLSNSIPQLACLRYLRASGLEDKELPKWITKLFRLQYFSIHNSSKISKLPISVGNLKDLAHLDLSECGSLAELPESVGNLEHLVHLVLSGCGSLAGLPESVGNLEHLVHLDLSGCESLAGLPESVGNLEHLVHLDLSRCGSLAGLPESVGNLENLVHLDLSRCGSLAGLPESVGNLENLVHLDLSWCESLVGLPESVGNLKNLVHLHLLQCRSLAGLPESVGNLENLEQLHLSWCGSLVVPESVGNLENLEQLHLSGYGSLVGLPESVGNLENLQQLDLSWCRSLVGLPELVGNLENLEQLDLSWCGSLVGLPESVGNLENLERLHLSWCGSLVGLPESVGNLENLEWLELSGCGSLVGLPESVGNLKNLERLDLSGSGSLVGLPESVGNLKNLERLDLSLCGSLVGLPESVGNLKNLEQLDLSLCGSLVGLAESVGNLKNLEQLDLSGCGSLVGLPESVGNLKNLEQLDLSAL